MDTTWLFFLIRFAQAIAEMPLTQGIKERLIQLKVICYKNYKMAVCNDHLRTKSGAKWSIVSYIMLNRIFPFSLLCVAAARVAHYSHRADRPCDLLAASSSHPASPCPKQYCSFLFLCSLQTNPVLHSFISNTLSTPSNLEEDDQKPNLVGSLSKCHVCSLFFMKDNTHSN